MAPIYGHKQCFQKQKDHKRDDTIFFVRKQSFQKVKTRKMITREKNFQNILSSAKVFLLASSEKTILFGVKNNVKFSKSWWSTHPEKVFVNLIMALKKFPHNFGPCEIQHQQFVLLVGRQYQHNYKTSHMFYVNGPNKNRARIMLIPHQNPFNFICCATFV